MKRTKEVIELEEQTEKNIEDFCDESYFREEYGDEWVDEHNEGFEVEND